MAVSFRFFSLPGYSFCRRNRIQLNKRANLSRACRRVSQRIKGEEARRATNLKGRPEERPLAQPGVLRNTIAL